MQSWFNKALLGFLWLFAIGIGTVVLLKYQNAQGDMGKAPSHWPASAPVSHPNGKPLLVLFAHPKCPCTQATMEQLNRLLARCSKPVAAHVFFLKPADAPAGWMDTSLRRNAALIPGVEVHEDLDGKISSSFGAKTSGAALLYDASGKLLFQGGITSARGHAGDNAGSETIVSLVNGLEHSPKTSPVFGCSITTECTALHQEKLPCCK